MHWRSPWQSASRSIIPSYRPESDIPPHITIAEWFDYDQWTAWGREAQSMLNAQPVRDQLFETSDIQNVSAYSRMNKYLPKTYVPPAQNEYITKASRLTSIEILQMSRVFNLTGWWEPHPDYKHFMVSEDPQAMAHCL